MQPTKPFVKGADVSLLKRNEDVGAVYTEHGQPKPALEIFKNHGFNAIRLRLFHTPNKLGSVINDLPYTLALARQVKEQGLGLLLNFHYSDYWADPAKQYPPAAWKDLSHDALVETVFAYTRDVVAALCAQGCRPEMVQIGNEITPGMLWEDGRVRPDFNTAQAQLPLPAEDSADARRQWKNLGELVDAGLRGVAAGAGPGDPVRTMIHLDRGGDARTCQWFFDRLLAQGVDWDVIGLSYYPFWHGTFDDLRATLQFLAGAYRQEIMVVETGFSWKPQQLPDPHDYTRKLSLEESMTAFGYPLSQQGQADFLHQLIQIVKETPGGKGTGVFYWAPEHIEIKGWAGPEEPDGADWYPRALFDENGEMTLGMTAFED